VSLTVVFQQTALRALARIRGEDKAVFARTRHAITALADQPYPDGAVAWGATGIYRLHAGEVRVLYGVDDEASTVYIINIGLI
jgi:mRNA-degrading endonuclease RelE of RelBE toxin-antitoxin system